MNSTSKVDRVRNHSLIDREANGEVAGEDSRVLFTYTYLRVDIRGIDDHDINSIPIIAGGRVTNTTIREVIIIIHQCAYYSKGNAIHSFGQLEHFKNFFDDKSIKVGDKQHILTKDNYMILVTIKNGLPCMTLCPYTEQ